MENGKFPSCVLVHCCRVTVPRSMLDIGTRWSLQHAHMQRSCTRPVCVSVSAANMDIDDHRQYYYNGNSSHSCYFHVNGCCRNDNGPAIEMKCAAKTNKTEIRFNIAILPGSFSPFSCCWRPDSISPWPCSVISFGSVC